MENFTNQQNVEYEKWRWCMSWCKRNGLPPAQAWVWKSAESAWEKDNDG
jgi:hypothetical protein